MKKKFVSLALCMALLSSFTVSASAYDINDVYNQVTAIRNELGYPQGNWSSLRRAVNYIADHMPNSSPNYSTVLSNIKSNSDSLVSYIKLIEGDTNNISARSTELLNKLQEVYLRQGQMQIAITNHIDSASAYDINDVYNQITAIRNELGYPQGNWSSLRRAVNYIADHMPGSPKDYSSVLSNIYSNTSSISSILSDLYLDNSGLIQRVIEIQSKIDVSNQHLGTISSSLGIIDSHIGSAAD